MRGIEILKKCHSFIDIFTKEARSNMRAYDSENYVKRNQSDENDPVNLENRELTHLIFGNLSYEFFGEIVLVNEEFFKEYETEDSYSVVYSGISRHIFHINKETEMIEEYFITEREQGKYKTISG